MANPFSGSYGKYGAAPARASAKVLAGSVSLPGTSGGLLPGTISHGGTPMLDSLVANHNLIKAIRATELRFQFPNGLFPGRLPYNKPPFGKRLPWLTNPPIPGNLWRKYAPQLGKPWVLDAAFMLGAWILGPKTYRYPSGWFKCWDLGGPKQAFSGPTTAFSDTCSTSSLDYNLGFQVPAGVDGVDTPFVIAWPGDLSFWRGPLIGGIRMNYTEKWRRLGGGPATSFPYESAVVPSDWPLQLPQWLWPWIDPLAPEPPPLAPPIRPGWPAPDPIPDPYGNPQPQPDPGPGDNTGDTTGTSVPSITIDIGGPPYKGPPDVTDEPHILQPPDKRDRERKKRVGGAAWLRFLNRTIGSFTETDDIVANIYRALPWRYRRWRGRDGVWRERDADTASRLVRLYDLFGKVDISQAIQNLIKNEVSDRAYGWVGRKLKQRARELGNAGLWPGSRGFQSGGHRLTEYNWDVMYAQLKAKAAREVLQHRKVRHAQRWNPKTQEWEWYDILVPVTQIPWFVHVSHYPHNVKQDYTGEVPLRYGYYYAPTDTLNPIKHVKGHTGHG